MKLHRKLDKYYLENTAMQNRDVSLFHEDSQCTDKYYLFSSRRYLRAVQMSEITLTIQIINFKIVKASFITSAYGEAEKFTQMQLSVKLITIKNLLSVEKYM